MAKEGIDTVLNNKRSLDDFDLTMETTTSGFKLANVKSGIDKDDTENFNCCRMNFKRPSDQAKPIELIEMSVHRGAQVKIDYMNMDRSLVIPPK